MGKAVIVVLGIVLFVYAVFDLIATPAERTRALPKAIWLVLLLVPVAGPLAWIFWGHMKDAPPTRGPRNRPGPSGPPRPLGPDDDPDYLRGL